MVESPFRWISVALSLVLGFGVTRLLSGGVAMFKSRSIASLDWIPLAWAACIFLWQLQFWWAVIELPSLIKTWHLGQFMILLSLTLLLFIAAALILPSTELKKGENLKDSFERDGHWALPCLSLYFFVAFVADWHFWGVLPFSYFGALLIALLITPLVFVFVSARWAQASITVGYILLSLWAAWELSPESY